ncbi:glycosyltransferase family 8 protein [Campylobacter sp. RM9756]|uniref:glycosyltransferase family 8 protein n=1 Tax=Campylobacter molothri TaxID=1032242 RepID=UPI001D47F046|nr:glycosyltransferase family 8 protein [Campylobacter sp. RM9756]
MLNIFFSADDNYVKFTSVLMNSIVNTIDLSKKNKDYLKKDIQEGFHFHIMSDFISENNLNDIRKLENKLNQIYPCVLSIHILDDKEFSDYPKWRGNYLAYYRIKLADFVDENTERCLYLDSDMLAMSDIREVLSINIDDYIVAACLDGHNYKKFSRRYKSKNENKYYRFTRYNDYFNSGFLYINVKNWKKYHVEEKCIAFLNQYEVRFPDQDALNYSIDKVKKVPIRWNFMIGYLIGDLTTLGKHKDLFRCQNKNSILNCTRKEFYNNLKDVKLIHYTLDEKPWNIERFTFWDNNFNIIDFKYNDIYLEFASKTPYFGYYFDILKSKRRENIHLSLIKSFAKFIKLKIEGEQFVSRKDYRKDYRKLRKMIVVSYILIFIILIISIAK